MQATGRGACFGKCVVAVAQSRRKYLAVSASLDVISVVVESRNSLRGLIPANFVDAAVLSRGA